MKFAPVTLLCGPIACGKSQMLLALQAQHPRSAFPWLSLENPVHPGAKRNCSLLNRHLEPLTGLQELPNSNTPLSRGQRHGVALLTGIDALRRARKSGAFLENPETGLSEKAQAALGNWLADLWNTKHFPVTLETHSEILRHTLEKALAPEDLKIHEWT